MTLLHVTSDGRKVAQATAVVNGLGTNQAVTVRFKELDRVLALVSVTYSGTPVPATAPVISTASFGGTPSDQNVVGMTVNVAAGTTLTLTATAFGF